jgi:hypothetical protein
MIRWDVFFAVVLAVPASLILTTFGIICAFEIWDYASRREAGEQPKEPR